MESPELVILARLRRALEDAFGPEHAATDPMLRRSDHADYQVNAAMGLAKQLRRPPRQVAEALLAKLELADLCERVEVSGPGFVNLTLRASALEAALDAMAADPALGVTRNPSLEVVVVDYPSPNIVKEMHVGHLRSTIIGDALCRVLEFRGERVLRQNHIGDWGTPFGMLIEHFADLRREREAAEFGVAQLTGFYQAARVKFDSQPDFAERSRKRVVLLQAGDPDTLALWQAFVSISRRYMATVYERLGATLSDADVRGESFYNDQLPGVAAELKRLGLAVESDGALCVFMPGFTGREGDPLPLMVQKQDGGFGYAATDLAALRYRREVLHATRLLYVVGAPQQQHLSMVFEAARLAGWLSPPARAEHVSFGSVLGEDRKMLKTRSGESPRLLDLLDEAVERAARAVSEKNPELDAAERARIANSVAIGAIKYGDLSIDRVKDYVFDFDRMLAFEGNTGPYLQYAHARIRSIFRKAGGVPLPAAARVTEPSERALGLELLGFAPRVAQVADVLQPHKLCTYLYDLAVRFTAFYDACPVLKAEPSERAARLMLCDLTARTLERGLGLLGIDAPERM